ncbi:MmcQ/YjbR family DNA-binding protein [Kovacikia minuta CCNUW1]|uniref:MmcQ/YjbR family DNA-binding protein n=1 Tax=Kovacikia minuta TaxID=2931930 RepID=UPI001CCDA3AE|nr:MmcQ/YjbR family DNA-binding protein [Kovacikia minuta]UBF28656.1 MmcQ/YjbR family DNA-binding protein [Kovacikia minuta CCNUW1]
MSLDQPTLIEFCRTLPHATEDVKWEHHLVFSIGGKMFAIFDPEQDLHLSLKSTQEGFMALTPEAGVIPAPYLARYYWICITERNALPMEMAIELIQESYQLVRDKLPAKVRKSFRTCLPENASL